jgi:cytochrome c nitrite reductase small subunit
MREKGAVLPLLLGVPVGILFGLAVFTFGYARGGSYMTDDPAACANCHVMAEQFSGWQKSSHRNAAVCNDCHTPPGVVPKYFTKALNGFNHSLAFTTGHYPEIIQITRRNKGVTQASCVKCHEEITSGVGAGRHPGEAISCTQCHRNVGHSH